MEMPITKPSMVSYADELDFPKLMGDLRRNAKTDSSELLGVLKRDTFSSKQENK